MINKNELISRLNAALISQLKGEQLILLPQLTENELSTLPAEQILLYDNFRQMQKQLMDAGQFVLNLSNGKLNTEIPKSNAINAPIKALHASLRHLKWQMQQLSHGDYNQKTNFLGEFSTVFNGLAEALKKKELIQAELNERDSVLKMISDNISDVIWVLDLDLKLTYISPSILNLRGYTAEDVMDQSLEERLTPDSLELVYDEIKQANERVSSGQAFGNVTLIVEQPRKDGSSVWVELVIGPVFDADNKLVGYSGISRDVTARRKAELALIESEQKFKILSQTTSSGIYVYLNQKFFMVNPAFESITEYSADELKDLGIADLVHPDFIEMVSKRAQERMEGKEPQSSYEIKIITKTGKVKWLDLSAGFINFFGKPAILGSIFDISHQKQIQIELERNLITKDKFLSIIGHDLIGPIGSINQLLDLITDKDFEISYEEREKTIESIKSTAANVFNLLENLLNWTRTQSGSFPFHPRFLNLNKLIKDNVSLFKSSAENKQIEIVYNSDIQVDAWFDFEMVNAIIRNLLNNAIKFSFVRGIITICSGVSGENFWVSIQDEGTGIEPGVMEHLFALDRGYKSSTGTQGETGTGLGLILCAEFAKKHGGYVEVSSETGKGSTFTVKLPMH
ncbi:MAG: PAS domain-containing sensor histidine kinase [Lentimicrobium sp.]|jgi:PAS domain S-box-containing protein|nr:PAS domain-containing sensor histidine kinase [Lentimicrobium sp.]MDY0024456.1 PAS domain-containing sensor histidine kinase [Lentimicrobium sp.]